MKIELRGVEFINKGAELMLHSIIEKLRNDLEDVEFVMEASGRVPLNLLKKYNIKMTTVWWKRGYNVLYLTKFLPQFILSPFGIIKSKNIDVVLDGSGFAFGDQWGAAKAEKRAAAYIAKWKAEGKKVILLPQAFGPFENLELVDKMKTILKHADKVYARDKMSFDYLNSIGDFNNIKRFPDFTNLLIPKQYEDKYENTIWVIPNSKMISATKAEEGQLYKDMVLKSIQYMQQQNLDVKFLIHEAGGNDAKLAKEINRNNTNPIDMVVELDPIRVKALIGSSYAVVSSRFHGLVSALSQAIPCLATGWSHKYEMLLQDYEYTDNLLDLNIDKTDLEKSLDAITETSSNKQAREHLKSKSIHQKQLASEMWNEVLEVIKTQ